MVSVNDTLSTEIKFCDKMKECGHECDGIRGEPSCLPCMNVEHKAQSVVEQLAREFKALSTDMCEICFDDLGEAPGVIMCKSNHVYHAHCIKLYLETAYSTLNITFGWMVCPGCKQ